MAEKIQLLVSAVDKDGAVLAEQMHIGSDAVIVNQCGRYGYEDMCHVAERLGLEPKERAAELGTWQEFYDWDIEVMEADYEYRGRRIEGFVIEDSAGYMTKLKLAYYNFWKFMRSVSHEAIRKGYITKTSALTTPLANEYYAWVRKLHDAEDRENLPRDICALRNMFYQEKGTAR